MMWVTLSSSCTMRWCQISQHRMRQIVHFHCLGSSTAMSCFVTNTKLIDAGSICSGNLHCLSHIQKHQWMEFLLVTLTQKSVPPGETLLVCHLLVRLGNFARCRKNVSMVFGSCWYRSKTCLRIVPLALLFLFYHQEWMVHSPILRLEHRRGWVAFRGHVHQVTVGLEHLVIPWSEEEATLRSLRTVIPFLHVYEEKQDFFSVLECW